MRGLVTPTLLVLALARSAAAQPEKPRPIADVDRTLTPAELGAYVEPYIPQIRTCYLSHARGAKATGVLRLELIIHRDGTVFKLAVSAPGTTGRKLDACVRALAKDWHFPVRSGFTTAMIPFFFQRTRAPGAGPIPGCYSTRGCPGRRR